MNYQELIKSRPSHDALLLCGFVSLPFSVNAESATHEAEIVQLEADVQTLNWFLHPGNPSSRSEYRLKRALEVAVKNPAQAQAYFELALKDEDLSLSNQALVHLEWGRILARDDFHGEAIEHFISAMELALRPHIRHQAIESYALSLRHTKVVGKLPTYLEKYEEYFRQQGKLDLGARETFYNIGYALTRSGDDRAIPILNMLIGKNRIGRRALYLLGAHEVRQENYKKAQALFNTATKFEIAPDLAPEILARDQAVRELAYMALGRVCFETRDFFNGIGAYQNIPSTSPNYVDAIYEMGWLALDHGEHSTALAALEPVAEARPNDALGWQALLLKGYVMLQKNNYQGAQQYYESLVEYFAQRSTELASEIGNFQPYSRLLDDLELKETLIKRPFLQKIYQEEDLIKASTLNLPMQEFAFLDREIAAQYLYIDTAQDETKTSGASASLKKDIELIDEKNNEIETLQKQKPNAEGLRRLSKLANMLTSLKKTIILEKERIKQSFNVEKEKLNGLKREREELEQNYQASLKVRRDELLTQAVKKFQRRIKAMSIEGEAGVLQAIWKYKEDQYNVIMGLVEARRTELGILDEQFQDTIDYLSQGPF